MKAAHFNRIRQAVAAERFSLFYSESNENNYDRTPYEDAITPVDGLPYDIVNIGGGWFLQHEDGGIVCRVTQIDTINENIRKEMREADEYAADEYRYYRQLEADSRIW